MRYHNLHKGFSLVETLIAIAVLLLAVVVPMHITTQSVKTASFAKEQLIAVHLAQEGIESFIALRDNDALDGGTYWDWYANLNANCKNTSVGCSINPSNGSVVACSGNACLLYVDEDGSSGALYTHTSNAGVASPYTRVVTLEEIVAGKEVKVTSTVSWNSKSFRNTAASVVEETAIFNQYE